MPRTPRLLSSLFAVGSVAFAGAAVSGVLPDPGWRYAVTGIGLIAAVAIARSPVPPVFGLVIAAAALRLATLRLPSPSESSAAMADSVTTLGVGIGLLALMLLAMRRRHGSLGPEEISDLLAAAIGTVLVAWVLVPDPFTSGLDAAAVVEAVYLPIATMLVVVAVDLTCVGSRRSPAMQLALAASGAHLVGAWLVSLRSVGRITDGADVVAYAAFGGALCAAAAALIHPSAVAAVSPAPRADRAALGAQRIVLVGVCTVLPIAVVAAVAPESTADAAIRVAVVTALLAAVTFRVRRAVRHDRRLRDRLLRQLAEDELTGLPTRDAFVERTGEHLDATWRSPCRPTIIHCNLDRFKHVNGTLGHEKANAVLIVFAERLRTFALELGGDVGRIGGDDFAIVDPGTTSAAEALERAEALQRVIAPAVTVGEQTVFLTASIGVATAPDRRTVTADHLLRQADIATQRAKQNGRRRIAVFDESMQAAATRRMDLEHQLHGALDRREMQLHYQPIIDIANGRVSGFEALMRWVRADGATVPPGDFIPVAEETGTILELGAWALEEALGELQRLIDDGVVGPSTTMSVNASPRQIADPSFPDVVRRALESSRVAPHLLWIEITESMMLEEPDLVQQTLAEIRSMGARIALDDFGTGFSALSVLQRFPLQRLKIDRAFVRGLATEPNDRSLVRTIIALARSMAFDVVAEGVETVGQLEVLRELGCGKAQGFLISRPTPASALRSTAAALAQLSELPVFAARERPTDDHETVVDRAAHGVGHTPRPPLVGPSPVVGPMAPPVAHRGLDPLA